MTPSRDSMSATLMMGAQVEVFEDAVAVGGGAAKVFGDAGTDVPPAGPGCGGRFRWPRGWFRPHPVTKKVSQALPIAPVAHGLQAIIVLRRDDV